METSKSVKKLTVNFDPDLDPDFGQIVVQDINAYIVTVSPKSTKIDLGFHCIVLTPKTEEGDESYALVEEILHCFLQAGDFYEVRKFSAEDIASYKKDTPTVSFNPQKVFLDNAEVEDSFFWLVPPRALMN